jgi:hypothetical protein
MPAAKAVPAAVGQAPMTTLLSWAWTAFTIEADNVFEARGRARFGRRFRISLAMWANGLRVIDEGGVTVSDAQAAARAACNLGGLERWGWISVGDPGSGRRPGYGSARGIRADTDLHPTQAGSTARRLWPSVVGRVEEAWRERFGDDVLADLRARLVGDPSMPWAPPEVHSSDGFFTHVLDGDGRVEAPPLVGLLGQALTARILDAEDGSGVSLPLAADLLRVIDGASVPVKELPVRSGVSKEAIAMAVGFATRRKLAVLAPDRSVRLSASGLEALERYRVESAGREPRGLRNALVALLGRTDALAEGLIPPEGCWRAERPYRAQTDRMLADPLGTLPWHPMVLHRGGWPDGS